jgi:hypothetical protein
MCTFVKPNASSLSGNHIPFFLSVLRARAIKIYSRWMVALLVMVFHGHAQVSIVTANVSAYNVSPKALLDISLTNNKATTQVTAEAKIFTSRNELLITVTSQPFFVQAGASTSAMLGIRVASVFYAPGPRASTMRSTNTLPGGKYTYCITIKGVDVSDELCQDMESENNSFLFLVSPPDKEELDQKYPVLAWTHAEPFTNDPTESYRLVMTELLKGQTPEGAINTNVPVYIKNSLTSHQVQYPIDATQLLPGLRYAWQVQKMSDGVIVTKTEAWEFRIKAPDKVQDNKYAVMKKKLDGTVYTASGNKIFFRFDEAYTGTGMQYAIYNDKQQAVTAAAATEKPGIQMESVKAGYNTYMIDLNDYKMPAGAYLLELVNDKRETFKLKFIIE